MHLLIVNQYGLPAGAAGITRHGDLGRELARAGHQVTVIASGFNYLTRTAGADRRRTERHDGVTFRWLQTGSYEANDSRRLRSMVSFTWRSMLLGLRMRPRPDVVLGSSPHLLAGISAWVIARRYRVPFLFEVRDPWPSALVDLGAVARGSRSHRLLAWIERFLYRRADRIVGVMEHVDRRVFEVGEDAAKCVHIPNASTVPTEYVPLPAPLDEVVAQEREDGRRIVLYTGAHGVSNGLGGVLDALDLLRVTDDAAYERLALVFVGGGPDRDGLAARAVADGHHHVHFLAPVSKDEVLAAMRCAAFVLVHFADADFKRFGMSANKLFDAMAVARPVLVATPLTDTPVDTARCGIRYRPGVPADLAAALARAVELSDSELEAMGNRGRVEMERRYSLEVTGRQLAELMTDVAGGR